MSLTTNLLAADCSQALDLCDRTIDAKNKVIELQDLGIKQLTDQNTQLSSDLKTEEGKAGAFYRNPWFLITLGFITGAVVMRK